MTRRTFPILVLMLTAVLGTSGSASATEVGRGRDFGLGLAFGRPSAIVGKVFAGPNEALDFGLGFRNYGYGRCDQRRYGCGNDNLSLHADYLRQENLFLQGNVVLDWYLGGGARVWFYDYDNNNADDDDLAISARMPVGLALMFRRPSFLEVYLEIVPSLWIYPGLYLGFDSALGFRIYF